MGDAVIYVWLILFIAVLSWREVQILIDRGSWKAEDYHKLFWYIHWESKWKNWDSFHVSNGLFTLILVYILYTNNNLPELLCIINQFITDILHIIAYWLIWMQIRNLFMKLCRK